MTKLVAVIDGCGDSANVGLYAEDDDQELVELEWPKGWPSDVSAEFLKAAGYELRIA